VPQPVVRLGNYLEVGNDVFMHLIATINAYYTTVENRDFEKRVRDRTNSRFPNDTAAELTDSDAMWFLNRFGVEFKYQKNLEFYLLFEHRMFTDGNLIDDRSNSTNPGGTDVFGRAAGTENPGFKTERYYIRYKFPGTPLKLHVGADLWNVDQAGIVGDDDPRIALFGEFGDFDVMGAAVIQYESQRIGLENDNDLVYYTFSAGYNLKPHRFQLDVVYFRDRFAGADLSFPRTQGGGIGFQGQKVDSVLIMGSWSGALGPIRALLQGNLVTGTARGGTAGLPGFPAGVPSQKDYDIFAGAAVASVEADLGMVKPFVAFVWGSGDGDPTDNKLHGFSPAAQQDVTQHTGVSWFEHLDASSNYAGRDYACPARNQGLRTAATAATGPLAIGSAATGGGSSGFECNHTVSNPFNQRIGLTSHLGLSSSYSNPGTRVLAGGLKVFPVKGHQLVGWYVFRGMEKTALLETAFAPELGGKSLRKGQNHEFGGYWLWTLNPYFDIRLSGNLAYLGTGFRDLARLSDCDLTTPGRQSCEGKDVALKGEARFRARF